MVFVSAANFHLPDHRKNLNVLVVYLYFNLLFTLKPHTSNNKSVVNGKDGSGWVCGDAMVEDKTALLLQGVVQYKYLK